MNGRPTRIRGADLPATGDLAKYAFTLDIERLRAALKPGVALEGLLIAAASAHDPEPRI
jgi:hypothetical protein